MTVQKISISLDERSLAALDAEVAAGRSATRSSAVEATVRLLVESRLADQYAAAYRDWDETEWDIVTGDGVTEP